MGRGIQHGGDFCKQSQCLFCFHYVETGEGEAGMDDDVVTNIHTIDQGEGDTAPYATHLDLRPSIRLHVEDFRGNG